MDLIFLRLFFGPEFFITFFSNHIVVWNWLLPFDATRGHPHVWRASALRVWVCARGGHLVHSSDPDRAADGGTDHPDLALAHGDGPVLQPGLLSGFPGLPQWILWWVFFFFLLDLIQLLKRIYRNGRCFHTCPNTCTHMHAHTPT